MRAKLLGIREWEWVGMVARVYVNTPRLVREARKVS